MAEAWEGELEGLSLEDKTPEEGKPQEQQNGDEVASNKDDSLTQTGANVELPDPALLSSLLENSKERGLVLSMETELLAFLSDTSRDIFEFPVDLSNYQRMLAHKVAQYYNLQTTTADHEGNMCRVVAHRTGVRDKNKPTLASLDVSAGSPLAVVAKNGSPWQDTPKLLKRPVRSDYSNSNSGHAGSAPRTTTPKDRQEEYERARARILSDSDGNSYSGASGGTPGRGMGRGGPYAGRGRRGFGRGRDDMYDPDYTRGMGRYQYYDGSHMHGMPMVMVPPGATPVFMTGQPQEMAWGPGGAVYATGRQPPPPPPATGTASSYNGGKATGPGATAMWQPAGAVMMQPAGTMTPTAGAGAGGTSVPPPPPPPPHGGPRAYSVPGGMVPAQAHYAQGGTTPMAVYPSGAMQPMPGMAPAMYTPYQMAGGAYAYMMPDGQVAMAPTGTPTHMAGYQPAAYPAGTVQPMAPQGYQPVYGSPMAQAAMPGMAGGMMMPRSPAAPQGVTMAYMPAGGMPGYTMPYTVQPHAAGMAPLQTAGSGGYISGATSVSSGYQMNGGGGRGAGRGGPRSYSQHQGPGSYSGGQHGASGQANGTSATNSVTSTTSKQA